MSGDVQPRKRKDKRRKRDDDESSHGVHITKMGNEDLHLHVHHEHGTGGHWCAKIIFFALMAVLLGLVGLIIMENRGLEDLDTPLSESRFSKVFDGWVDEHRDEHDAHDVHEPSGEALDDHDDHDEHDEEEEPLSEELEEEEEEPTEEEQPEADEEEPEQEEEEDDDEENNAGENITAEDAEEEDEGTVEATVEATAEATTEATAEYEAEEDEEEDEDEAPADKDDAVESTEAPLSEADEQEEDDEDEEEQEVEESVEPPRSQSAAQSAPAPDDNDEDDEEQDNKEDEEDDDDFESLDQQFENEPEELEPAKAVESKEQDKDQDDDEEEHKEEGSSWLASLAVKFGVGVALALVSRLVLIRKSPNTTEDEPAPEAIMRRRLTIATAEDHIPDDVEELPLLDDDEYSEEEIEIEEEIEVEISDIEEEEDDVRHDSDDNVASMASYVPETFEQLSAMYKFAQQPEKETKPEEKEKDLEQPAGRSDIYVEYEDGAIEDFEHEGDSDEEEITDEEEDEISDVDDADLMNRLEAKYGRLPVKEFESDPDSDDPSWTQIKPKEAAPAPVSAEKEDPFEQELRKANEEMIRENYAQALRSFNTLTTDFAHEPLAHLGRARVLELLAKKERSNQRLWEAIDAYKRYLAFGELVNSDQEFTTAGEKCIENLRFLGYHRQATTIHELLIERLPGEPRLRNQLSLTHLMVNNLQQVEKVSKETLKLWPTNAVAQLHYGLALRQLHGDNAKALPYLRYAVESQEEGTQEAFFYLSLGEALQRLSKNSEALEVFRKGVAKGFFASLYQRSLYNEPRLKAQPFWQPRETGYERQLENLQVNWRVIRDEGLTLLGGSGFFEDEAEQLRDKGVWQQYVLYSQGRRERQNCQRAPITCSLLEDFPESSGCRRGQVKFSVMQATTHVWPHCGPTNCRLRAHLTLVAPEPEKTSLRVAEQERTWREGELFIFDDSFEHEVWHNGSRPRLVLILDMWHPQLSAAQRRSLSPI
ncbi:aspartyl/asparaginyl beta-hydroxylase isoform X3 [Drosophila takahashii]|uniref:aspartyl/asparaginyl beta-hydroxylase isoform X3 n=1 Tax=Drosophila takahashii TaxID=29030 RepID=UPI001CF8921B|nr:aspartyl/asparaginyl beta-hydroxylase isoform X1 [Drosophila takahashii]